MIKFWNKLKTRWEVESNIQALLIILVFAATGMSAVQVRKFLVPFIGLDEITNGWIRIPIVILMVFACYQVLLLFYGFLFGQFKFFWKFEKRFLKRLGINLDKGESN